ncbi:Protein kinase C-binding protein NELL2 [Liparis tanakae]|uniref:Protein kinase C-binding protein NELL2 n=1 Tax=Liparis tanakae TaxID=230148 RepID=A0A4Z2IE49_9TELE|nr:Protein kinase C-binding protein NELL2 [Liparis tanakae]
MSQEPNKDFNRCSSNRALEIRDMVHDLREGAATLAEKFLHFIRRFWNQIFTYGVGRIILRAAQENTAQYTCTERQERSDKVMCLDSGPGSDRLHAHSPRVSSVVHTPPVSGVPDGPKGCVVIGREALMCFSIQIRLGPFWSGRSYFVLPISEVIKYFAPARPQGGFIVLPSFSPRHVPLPPPLPPFLPPSIPLSTPPSAAAAPVHAAVGASVQLVSSPADNNDTLAFCVCKLVVGYGVDPALRINVFDELTLGDGFDGVTQVQGFHSESRAFHFQDIFSSPRTAAETAALLHGAATPAPV